MSSALVAAEDYQNQDKQKASLQQQRQPNRTNQTKRSSHFDFTTQHHLNLTCKNLLQRRHLLKSELETGMFS